MTLYDIDVGINVDLLRSLIVTYRYNRLPIFELLVADRETEYPEEIKIKIKKKNYDCLLTVNNTYENDRWIKQLSYLNCNYKNKYDIENKYLGNSLSNALKVLGFNTIKLKNDVLYEYFQINTTRNQVLKEILSKGIYFIDGDKICDYSDVVKDITGDGVLDNYFDYSKEKKISNYSKGYLVKEYENNVTSHLSNYSNNANDSIGKITTIKYDKYMDCNVGDKIGTYQCIGKIIMFQDSKTYTTLELRQ